MLAKAGQDLNRAQFAQFAGVALTTVDHWIRAGLPASKKGKSVTINSKEAIEWRIERAKFEALKATTDETPDSDIRRRREIAEMERAVRANALEAGEVARIEEMSAGWREVVAVLRSGIDAIPARFSMKIAHACASVIGDVEPEKIELMRRAAEQQMRIAKDELREQLADGSAIPDIDSGEEDPLQDAA